MISNLKKTTQSMQQSPQLVLQGEYGVCNRGLIKTSTPFSCIVIVARSEERPGVGFLSHLDDYTSSIDVISKIITLFNSAKPAIQILGGGHNLYARKHFTEINAILKLLNIPSEKIPMKGYCDRPQIVLNTENGSLTFLEGSKKDESLENFQKSEFGKFNDFLGRVFSESNGHEIPDFLAKKATRTIHNRDFSPTREPISPQFETATLLKFLEIKSYEAGLPIPLKMSLQKGDIPLSVRLASVDKSFCPILNFLLTFRSRLGFESNHNTTIEEALTLAKQIENTQAIALLKAPIQTDEDQIIKQLETVIISDLNLPKPLISALVDGDWNLLFKNACREQSYISLLQLLCDHLQILSINPKHKETKSASNGLEIAMSCNNKLAINLFINKKIYSNKEVVQTNLKLLIVKLSKDHDLLADLEEESYLSLLRRVAHSPKYLPILRSIVNNAKILEVDIHAKDEKMSSALEIATQAKNKEAIELLKL